MKFIYSIYIKNKIRLEQSIELKCRIKSAIITLQIFTQIKENQKDNFKAAQTLNQAIRRYNQLFSGMMEITIAGDFSLHAGDVIFVDIFSVQAEKDDTVNRESGGLYIIADLCHFIDAGGTYTKLNLARDSFGRKGNHSRR